MFLLFPEVEVTRPCLWVLGLPIRSIDRFNRALTNPPAKERGDALGVRKLGLLKRLYLLRMIL